MTCRAPRITSDVVIRVLRKLGFTKVSQKGSHQKWLNPKMGKKIIVPYHNGDIIKLSNHSRRLSFRHELGQNVSPFKIGYYITEV